MNSSDIVSADRAHLWHPYSPSPASCDSLPVASASGAWITLSDGRRLIDGMSSWWAVIHGHRHPHLIAAAHRQLDQLPHIMFGGLTHEPAVQLAEKLIAIAGHPLDRVFFSDSGSVAVEVAIKMALQYQRGQGHPERTQLLAWRYAYHGDTFGAMSVCDPDNSMHSIWAGTVAEQAFAPAPPTRGSTTQERETYLEEFEKCLNAHVAAVIIEPVVQGAGGMRFHDHELLTGIRQICDRNDVLLIADEIATGFGRTGDLLVTRAAGISADILCVGKSLTGGVMTLAATLTTESVAAAIRTPAGGGALMHGPTFMGNPLACSVACASLELLDNNEWKSNVARIEEELEHGLAPLREVEGVADVRVLGAIGVVELTSDVDMELSTNAAVAEGVWLRPFGRLIYTMPPFICSTEEIEAICRAITAAVLSTTNKDVNS